MQFIKNGPDIPERLLQAHEDGKVAFFCGAGISYPAGLPDFEGLVRQLYKKMGGPRTEEQKQAIESEQFDIAINLLESDTVGCREAVREKLFEILQPEWSSLDDNATATHKALLTLGKSREGQMLRLVTTNFDRIFEKVINEEAEKKGREEKEERYQAPLLPVPKNHWDGLVYLHGLLPPDLDSRKLDQLVVSSGDFGLAYLTERWAARFASELFRNYIVCFVGYSINDPILRYIMDALAADRLRGEISPEMFAFGSYSKDEQDKQTKQWEAKNVTPILYSECEKHFYLHETLRSWSKIYLDPLKGKRDIVRSLAHTIPSASTKEDNFVGRMLWALSDLKGKPAKYFAEYCPVIELDWLDSLSEDRYRHNDLSCFGVAQKSANENEPKFSFIKRPSPKAPFMVLVDVGVPNGEWDEVMRHLGNWLVRHLDDPKLVLWVAKQGGCLHYEFKELIQQKLKEFDEIEKKLNALEKEINKLEKEPDKLEKEPDKLEKEPDKLEKELDKLEKEKNKLEKIRADAPKAIPDRLMRTLWELILSGRLKQFGNHHNYSLLIWFGYFNMSGLTPSLRMKLREILTPRIDIQKPFAWGDSQSDTDTRKYMRNLISGEIVLAGRNVHDALKREKNNSDWKSMLPDLLGDFNLLLKDAFDLMRALEKSDDSRDPSYFEQPSISEHSQNKTFNDWTALIDLTRDAWLATAEKDIDQARLVAEEWWKTPYPLFKRLAFFAAAEREDVISCQQALSWLFADDNWWLWSVGTQRETMCLLASLASRLDATAMNQLEQAILQGPPRKMFIPDIRDKEWNKIVDEAIWLRLARLQNGDAELSQRASSKLKSLTKQHSWHLAEDGRDDFPTWFGPGEDIKVVSLSAPHTKDGLIKWLHQYPKEDIRTSDDWRDRCKQDVDTTADALIDFVNKEKWLKDRWWQAFSAWADDKCLKKSWDRIPKVIIEAPDSLMKSVAVELGWWLREQAGKFEGQEKLFFSLIERILKLEHQGRVQSDDDPLFRAINHPVGIAMEALLRWWYRRSLEDGQGLPDEIRPLFTKICDTECDNFRPGRTVLGAHVITLFRIDEEWTSTNLLPLFDWQQSEAEARTVWVGFLRSTRLYWPLMAVIKQHFLETAKHYKKLGMRPEQYTSLLMFVALDSDGAFKEEDIRNATCALPQEGLLSITNNLTRALKGAGEQRVDYWRNRVLPYFKSIWPKSHDSESLEISASLAQLCVAAQEVFPEAYKELRHWLRSLEEGDVFPVVLGLHKAKLSEQFPKDVLEFLDTIIGDEYRFPPSELGECLEDIQKKLKSSSQNIENNRVFQRLSAFIAD